MAMEKVMVAMTAEMLADLEKECKKRRLPSVPELIRQIISDHLRNP